MGLRAMKVLIRVFMAVLLLIVGTSVYAGSVWDGSVSTARYGYLPQTGMFAASNAFPKNSKVSVTNPSTGKTVDVVVIERLDDNNLFLVLSSEASDSIGIRYGDIFYGNISEQDITSLRTEEELPYNPDPDVNPSASSEDYSEFALIQDYIDSELGGSDSTLLVPIVADPIEIIIQDEAIDVVGTVEKADNEIFEEDIPSIENMPMEEIYIGQPKNELLEPEVVLIKEQETVLEPETSEEDVPVSSGMSADVPVLVLLADVSGVLPKLPVPETDIPVFTSMGIVIVEEPEDGASLVKLPELPIIEVEVIEEEMPLAVTMADDVVPFEDIEEISYLLPELVDPDLISSPDVTVISTEETEPEIISSLEDTSVSDGVDLLADSGMEVEIVLEPSDLRPPVFSDEVKPEETEELDSVEEIVVLLDSVISEVLKPEETLINITENYNVTKVLAEGFYYLQIGVYREQYSALNLASRLGGIYPVTVLVSENVDVLNYKVMVGPLGQDESGAVLYSFKSTGYPDAFLRKGL